MRIIPHIIPRLFAIAVFVCLLSACSLIRNMVSRPLPSIPETKTEAPKERPVITEPEAEKKIEEAEPDAVALPEDLAVEDKSMQDRILRIAKSKLGCGYSYAGKGPNSFDCSGFTGYVFRQVGIKLGASSRDQFLQGREIKKGEPLRPGDLVFWNGRSVGNTIGHVGIVVDYDKSSDTFTFIHAAVSTGVEIMKSTQEYYARRYMGARRILEDVSADSIATAEAEPEPEPAPAEPEPVYHTVKSGDTLSAIALKYHTSVSKLCSLNGITTKTILKIGRKLRVK